MKSDSNQDALLAQASEHHNAGRLKFAEQIYRSVLATDPNQAIANLNLGVLAFETGRIELGLEHLQKALEIEPDNANHWLAFAQGLLVAQHTDDALTVIKRAKSMGLETPAFRDLISLIEQSKDKFEKLVLSDSPHLSTNTTTEACHIGITPCLAREALLENLRLKRFNEAEEQARQLTSLHPNDAIGWKVLGTLLAYHGNNKEALSVLEKAENLDPNDTEILNSLGRIYRELNQLDKSVDIFKRALELKPDFAEIWNNQGITLQLLGRAIEAQSCYEQAIRIRPSYAKAYNNLGNLYRELGQASKALNCYEQSLTICPESTETLNNQGIALQDLYRFKEALVSFEKVLAITPQHTAALTNRGNVFKEQGLLNEAINCYRQVIKIQPDFVVAWQNLLFCLNYRCDITKKEIFAEHIEFARLQEAQIAPFPELSPTERITKNRLRIGLVSGDFRLHSVAFFLLPVLENIDRKRFEIFCYSTNKIQDSVSDFFYRLADAWIESSGLSYLGLAKRIREDSIDLLFDLSGHSNGNSLLAFIAKPAPIQISWLGYPNTTGLKSMDYRLVDAISDPIEEDNNFYSECLIRLPRGFLCYRPWNFEAVSVIKKSNRKNNNRIKLGSFNNITKISPKILHLWAEIMNALPNSHLILKSHAIENLDAWNKIIHYFVSQGVSSERISTRPRANSYAEHLAQYMDIDIALDTFPYHGTTTTCEALFMGVPVITLSGDRHVSRVGVSLLTQIKLQELIAQSPEDYVRITCELANNKDRLHKLHIELRERLEKSPIRNEVRFTRILEKVLLRMWEIWCAGKKPCVFEVCDFLASDLPKQDGQKKSSKSDRPKNRHKKSQIQKKNHLSAFRRLGKEISIYGMDKNMPTLAEQTVILDAFNHENYEEAEKEARKLTKLYPNSFFSWKALGTILTKTNCYQEALPLLLEAIRLSPDDAESIHNLGFALLCLGRLEEAEQCLKRALEIKIDYVDAYINLGTTYKDKNRLEDAMGCYEKALIIDPNNAEAHCNKGIALEEAGRLNEALLSYEKALSIYPNYAQALNNMGNTYKSLGRLDEAVDAYQKALQIQPSLSTTFSNLLLCLNYQADIEPEFIFTEHQRFDQNLTAKISRMPLLQARLHDQNRILNIGFVSGDFRLHSVAFFLLPVLEKINRKKFKVFCYSIGHRQDEVTKKFRDIADSWRDCYGLQEKNLTKNIRADKIDLLFDLSGHTSPNALLAFAAKPAPIQISWLGYPNTTGLAAMDYRLVDELTDPPGESDLYHSERLIRLPRGFLCYRPWSSSKDLKVASPPCLESSQITFGSFNNLAKITSKTLDLWSGVMKAVPNARLLLKSHTASDIEIWDRLVNELVNRGISTERLEILPRAPSYTEHLSQYNRIDIGLDTFPYHGTTTTCEALFMGVPVVSLMGDRHVARVGGSLLTQVGLANLAAYSTESYINIAQNLASQIDQLIELRFALRDRLENSSLWDSARFTFNLENALRKMWCIWCANEPPRVFEVSETTTVDPKKMLSKLPIALEQDRVISFFEKGNYVEAEAEARQLIHKYPDSMFVWKMLGTILFKIGRYEAALPVLLEANRLAPKDHECLNSLGLVLQHLGRLNEALSCFQRSIEINPNYALSHNNMGAALSHLGRFKEALNFYQQALKITPDSIEVHSNRALTLHLMGHLDESLRAFDRILDLKPDVPDILNKRGILLQNLGRLEKALESFDKALEICPNSADALTNRGNVLKDQGYLKEALACYHQAIQIQPELLEPWHNRLLCLNYFADLTREKIYADHCAFETCRAIESMPTFRHVAIDRNLNRRLRIGFVSGDFRHHSVAFFLLPVLDHLNREQFQIYCYSTSILRDELTQSFRILADHWVDSVSLGIRALANRINADKIDVLVDLSGHTEGNKLPTFAAKPAPIQVTWLGYPNTTGLKTIDYRIVDNITDPPGDADDYHSEHLIRLPGSFLCYRQPDRDLAPSIDMPPFIESGRITFGSFNNLAKVTPSTLQLWAAVLRSVTGSRLMLKTSTTIETRIWDRVLDALNQEGVEADRVEILPRAPSYKEHLALYSGIDIALDTFPYHGTTTTCEALFMGVPVITLAGDRHASRVGASLLTHVGLQTLIANSIENYVRLAIELANNHEYLCALRFDLRKRLAISPVCDEIGFTRAFESILREMWRIWCSGESPRAFADSINI